MNPRLTAEQRDAVDKHDGCVEVEDANGKCVLMSIEVFREVMGVSSDRDLQESVAALRRSYEQFANGQTRPLTEALDELGTRYGLSR
jgi:hypothetical protein